MGIPHKLDRQSGGTGGIPTIREVRLGVALGWLPAVFLVMVVLASVIAPLIAPDDPLEIALSNRLVPPVWHPEGNWGNMLGTDAVGRDILSRIIYGSRASLTVAGLSLMMAASVGTVLGVVSGYVGGRVDSIVMRFADITLGFPLLLFALFLTVTWGPSMVSVATAIAVIVWARFARMVRSETLSIKERDYIALAQVTGLTSWRIAMRHVLPNVASVILTFATLQFGWIILTEASLSFLGAGIPPPTPTWGSMVAQGREFVVTAYWVPLMPGIAITTVVLASNLLGDALRDRLDPRSQGKLT